MASAQSKPPRDGIPINQALREFHLSHGTITNLIETDKVRAGSGIRLVHRKNNSDLKLECLLVSRKDLEKIVRTLNSRQTVNRTPPPRDGVPVGDLARELEIPLNTLKNWCEWKTQPALGRKLASGIGEYIITDKDGTQRQWRGLLVSRLDAATCATCWHAPLLKTFPGQDGVWIAPEVYFEGGEHWFTESYIQKHYKIAGKDSLRWHTSKGRLERRLLTRPIRAANRWQVAVWSKKSIEALLEYRKGKSADGEWLTLGEIWHDAEGNWFSSAWIANRRQTTTGRVFEWRTSGVLNRYKEVPLGIAHQGRRAVVHHESEVFPLLGLASLQPAAAAEVNEADAAAAPEQPAPAPKLKAPAGRRIDKKNLPKYRRCHELYTLVGEQKIKMRSAVMQVLTEFGADSLGKDSSLDDQKTQLRRNAKTYRKAQENQ